MERSKRFRQEDVEITHTKGSGPGGQHRNKRMTGVRAVHRPTGIAVEATERRSQAQNLANALERLERKVERHFFRPKRRLATRPTSSSRARRADDKMHRARRKGDRKSVRFSGD